MSASQIRPSIAIVGMGCRMPKGDGIDAFWRTLRDGVDAISEVPGSRWDVDELSCDDASTPGKTYCRFGGFVTDGDCFDADVFDIDPREAKFMDPQQGMVLECAWHALEHAGIAPTSLRGSNTGTFVGISNCDFDRKLCGDLTNLELLAGTGTSYSIVANRLAYALGLCGPSIAVDLACASSLIAVHLACQSLICGECDMALAGGVHLILSPEKTITFSRGNALARDGRCKSFAGNADGYVRGEGCGMIALKRLDDAQRDGDPIVALIRGSATNHNGPSNGLSAPLGSAQERVVRTAYAAANIDPSTVGYIEAHSPGTLIGDQIEVRALAKVLTPGREPGNPCLIGSVKSNIGHLEGAAGIASLIKAALTVNSDTIPQTLHAEQLNRNLPLVPGMLEIATQPKKWKGCRRAGVSSFSFGGANAHVLVEEPPRMSAAPSASLSEAVLVLSARSPQALREQAAQYAEYLREDAIPESFFGVCYTAATGRSHFPHRLAIVSRSAAEASRSLIEWLQGANVGDMFAGVAPMRAPPIELRFGAACELSKLKLPSPLQQSADRLLEWFAAELANDFNADERIHATHLFALVTLLRVAGLAPAFLRDDFSAAPDYSMQRLLDAPLQQRAAAALNCELKLLQRCQLIDRKVITASKPANFVIDCAENPASFLQTVASAYVAGITPAWEAVLGERRRVSCAPKYPFQRNRYWIHSVVSSAQPTIRQQVRSGNA